MSRILITGAAGYIGSKAVSFLAERQNIEKIAGIDIKNTVFSHPKFSFYQRDVRDPIDDILRDNSIDAVIHTAFIVPPLHNKILMEDININGTRSVIDSCAAAGICHIIYTSSTTAYGFHPDNDIPLREESRLRGNENITYSKSKRIIEEMIADFARINPSITVTVLRACFVVGPGFNNPLADHVNKKFVFIPSMNHPLQFVHEDDLIEIIALLLARKSGGIFNIAGDGLMTMSDMARILGNIPVRLPYRLLYALNSAAWILRLSFLSKFPSTMLDMLRYSWISDNEKLKKELGYSYRYSTRKAFEDYARSISKLPAVN